MCTHLPFYLIYLLFHNFQDVGFLGCVSIFRAQPVRMCMYAIEI
jgi:hypothetical protein